MGTFAEKQLSITVYCLPIKETNFRFLFAANK
jgi:hypothetical protein